MGIVSSAKLSRRRAVAVLLHVSIPDGDSFLREVLETDKIADAFKVSIPDGDSFLREDILKAHGHAINVFQSPMGIVSSAKVLEHALQQSYSRFQSPMGIVSSAKFRMIDANCGSMPVSIPDGDSFLREAVIRHCHNCMFFVSIPDGDSFLREGINWRLIAVPNGGFNPRWG